MDILISLDDKSVGMMMSLDDKYVGVKTIIKIIMSPGHLGVT